MLKSPLYIFLYALVVFIFAFLPIISEAATLVRPLKLVILISGILVSVQEEPLLMVL